MKNIYASAKIIILCLFLPGCAMPRWGNKLTTLILPDGRIYKAYVSSDGRMKYKDAGFEWEIDNRGAQSLPEELAKAAAYGLTKEATLATVGR